MIEICLCLGTAFFFSAEDEGRRFLRKFGMFVPDYMGYVPADRIAGSVMSDTRVSVDPISITTV
jgi:hypothetical protein